MQLHQAPDHLAHHLELQGGGVGLSTAPRAAKVSGGSTSAAFAPSEEVAAHCLIAHVTELQIPVSIPIFILRRCGHVQMQLQPN